jgi:hypothetical protein
MKERNRGSYQNLTFSLEVSYHVNTSFVLFSTIVDIN